MGQYFENAVVGPDCEKLYMPCSVFVLELLRLS